MEENKIYFNSSIHDADSFQAKDKVNKWSIDNKKTILKFSEAIKQNTSRIKILFCGQLNCMHSKEFVLIPIDNKDACFCYADDKSDISQIEAALISGKKTFLYDKSFYSNDINWFKEKIEYFNLELNDDDFIETTELIESFDLKQYKRLPRDKKIVNLFRDSVIQECMICGTKNTFIDNKNEQYFEVHHVIPFDTITKLLFPNVNLDIIENLSLLCPTCHRKVHLGNADSRSESIDCLLKSNDRNIDTWNKMLGKSYEYEQLKVIINEIYRKIFKLNE